MQNTWGCPQSPAWTIPLKSASFQALSIWTKRSKKHWPNPYPLPQRNVLQEQGGWKAVWAENELFKQLNRMTKEKLMTFAAHTFPVLEEVQISWLGSFPQDEGLPPSHGCRTHGSSLPAYVQLHGCIMLMPSGGKLFGQGFDLLNMFYKACPQKHRKNK